MSSLTAASEHPVHLQNSDALLSKASFGMETTAQSWEQILLV